MTLPNKKKIHSVPFYDPQTTTEQCRLEELKIESTLALVYLKQNLHKSLSDQWWGHMMTKTLVLLPFLTHHHQSRARPAHLPLDLPIKRLLLGQKWPHDVLSVIDHSKENGKMSTVSSEEIDTWTVKDLHEIRLCGWKWYLWNRTRKRVKERGLLWATYAIKRDKS